jgi:hypothetical protein
METDSRNVWQRLVAVRRQVGGIGKDGNNSAQKFKFVSSNNVLSTLRPLLDAEGLALEQRVLDHVLHSKWSGPSDQKEHLTELTVEFVWVNMDNPTERIVCPWYGQGLDTGEKGVGKALTYAEKYFLLKQFSIPTDEDDPDSGAGSNGHQQRASQPAQSAPATRPAAETPLDLFKRSWQSIGLNTGDDLTHCKAQAGLADVKLSAMTTDQLRALYDQGVELADWMSRSQAAEAANAAIPEPTADELAEVSA